MVSTINLIKYFAIIGDVAYILFLLYNGIDEGFKDIGSVQSIAPIGMIFLLILNIFLLIYLKKRQK